MIRHYYLPLILFNQLYWKLLWRKKNVLVLSTSLYVYETLLYKKMEQIIQAQGLFWSFINSFIEYSKNNMKRISIVTLFFFLSNILVYVQVVCSFIILFNCNFVLKCRFFNSSILEVFFTSFFNLNHCSVEGSLWVFLLSIRNFYNSIESFLLWIKKYFSLLHIRRFSFNVFYFVYSHLK